MLPPIERLPRAHELIERGHYFVVHAPRQTGKTTTLIALAKQITAQGEYAALHVNCEAASSAGDEHPAAQRTVLRAIQRKGEIALPAELRPPTSWPDNDDNHLFSDGLSAWVSVCPRPLVLILNEIDSLHGVSLRAILRQLRTGYETRPANAPWSVILCGLRDVRDYKAASGGDPERLGTSSPPG